MTTSNIDNTTITHNPDDYWHRQAPMEMSEPSRLITRLAELAREGTLDLDQLRWADIATVRKALDDRARTVRRYRMGNAVERYDRERAENWTADRITTVLCSPTVSFCQENAARKTEAGAIQPCRKTCSDWDQQVRELGYDPIND